MEVVGASNSQLARSQQAKDSVGAQASKGASASKYDFVKVKVWLEGGEKAHYYVLSRFLVSRALTVTRIPHMKAVKIALELKKFCVDNDLLDISQAQLEEALFSVMRARGFGDVYVTRYKMVSALHLQRRPLIIFLCGSACTGKSTLAQQLAARLNMPNVLQTDIIYEMLRESGRTALEPTPLWLRRLPPDQLIAEYLRECAIVRRGINSDLDKVLKDGKSFIMEGMHLEPGMYLYEFGRLGQPTPCGSLPLTPQPSLQHPSAEAAACGTPTDTAAAIRSDSAEMQPSSGAATPTAAVSIRSVSAELPPYPAAAAPAAPASLTDSARSTSGPLEDGAEGPPSSPSQSKRQRLKAKIRSKLPRRGSIDHVSGKGGSEASPSVASGVPPAFLLHYSPAAAGGTQPPPSPQKHTVAPKPDGGGGQQEAVPAATRAGPERRESRVLFALRRQDSGSVGAVGGGARLQPRLAPWSTAKRVLEALRPQKSGSVETLKGMDTVLHSLRLWQTKTPQPAATPPAAAPDASSHGAAATEVAAATAATRSTPVAHTTPAAEPRGACQHNWDGLLPQPAASTAAAASTSAASAVSTATAAVPAAPSSTAAAAPAAAGVDDGSGGCGGDSGQPAPVFVPIVLDMESADHEPLLHEWAARQLGGECSSEDTLASLRGIQDHLRHYQGHSVPVVRISATTFTRTLDEVHDYLLQCMQLAVDAG
mmetsp:Transcript_20455/g.61589  ORF Transcript_20455/g.61589 Transcript_20455/m.61589 type:complete len:709 (-) Transcript_20455:317-2443(-)|eukprot:CAMPEP_0206142626 /NCGR_PEP_ID=MMETSP1473-20131121/17628_1 /ASSEMBLY_ACC=CAM_ASM_001109 /TAXON_ID=1461547 /ORGANISM="Stichococcus sp, Strain RCC1054" /LENGTH=708 /DNA_ID=CAMNT_0053537693 /DNA_START=130 /DNA_END=2256 /DNA_ORIENTATION=-